MEGIKHIIKKKNGAKSGKIYGKSIEDVET